MHSPDHFFDGAWQGVWPLLVWASHFAFSYLLVALGCIAGLDAARWAGVPIITWILLSVSAAALVGLGWLAATSARGLRSAMPRHDTLAGVRAGAALLAWIGVLWTTLPIVVLPVCSATG